jgi:NifU-like protein
VVYPVEVANIINDLRHAASGDGNCVGSEANFACGCVIRFQLSIGGEDRVVEAASYTSNGCGWMVASAEVIARSLSGKALSDLHGLNEAEPRDGLPEIQIGRETCIAASFAAAKAAFADLRSRQVEEFRGEKALICTCFGVTEERIEAEISLNGLTTVDEVGVKTNAGTGCGSCRMLIEELLDAR